MVWTPLQEVLVKGPLWVTEVVNGQFSLQRRKGRGSGISGLIFGTIDSVWESKSFLYRILYTPPDSEVSYSIAESNNKDETDKHWNWLANNLAPSLVSLDNPDDMLSLVNGKIASLLAESCEPPSTTADNSKEQEKKSFQTASHRFITLFDMHSEEKLVNYYSCSLWKNKVPRQGWMYLSVNYMCFYSYLVGTEVSIVLAWVDIKLIERGANLLLPESIRVATREEEVRSHWIIIN
uniref:GRAM domain-containing protein n=1 Tax=Macrostomum lignano TaxID=282301 RepID=A0A1I8I6T3_9PLAT